MTNIETIIRNFEEIRTKSRKLWAGLPQEFNSWRPDVKAFSCIEMVRHVLETEYVYHVIINNKGGHGDVSTPWKKQTLHYYKG